MARSYLSPARTLSSGSSASVEESEELFSKEEERIHDFNQRYRALQRAHRRLRRWFIGLSFVLVILAMTSISAQIWQSVHRGEERASRDSPLPILPIEKVTFEEDKRFAFPSSQESDEAWQALMPEGDGFILLSNPLDYNLPPGKSTSSGGPTAQIYDTSLFHQLHCLKHIREFLYTMKSSIVDSNVTDMVTPMLAPQTVWEITLAPQEGHVRHCFDYIRQAIMCAGDLTLEWPRTEEDGRRFAVDGWGITHECVSWEGVMKWMDENGV